MAGERIKTRLLPIQPPCAVQEQQRLAFAHAPDIDLAARTATSAFSITFVSFFPGRAGF
jgi:hypothetical protein